MAGDQAIGCGHEALQCAGRPARASLSKARGQSRPVENLGSTADDKADFQTLMISGKIRMSSTFQKLFLEKNGQPWHARCQTAWAT